MSTKSKTSLKLRAAKRSLTVWFSAAVPVLLAVAEALKDNIPALSLSGWKLVAASALVSCAIAALHVRSVSLEDTSK